MFVISCNDYDKDAIIASVDFETISSHCSHELMSQIFATTCDSCKEFASSISKELPALKSTFDTNMVYLKKYIWHQYGVSFLWEPWTVRSKLCKANELNLHLS